MNFVVNMLARPERITTSQIGEKNVDKAMEIYLKNSFVSLCSVKMLNSDVKCILYVNFQIDVNMSKLFEKAGIEARYLEYGTHAIDDQYAWSIVNYRYDVMYDLTKLLSDDDKVVMLDTDTICVLPLDDMFKELDYNILMYDLQHAWNHKGRKNIIDNCRKIYRKELNVTQYGGEFIAANGKNFAKLYKACKQVMDDSKNSKDLVDWNDEHITSIAIQKELCDCVHSGNAYIYRYWTGRFYLASTNYKNDPVCIWHVPYEKNSGFIRIFNYFIIKGKFPVKSKMAKIFGFPKSRRPFSIRFYAGIIKKLIMRGMSTKK